MNFFVEPACATRFTVDATGTPHPHLMKQHNAVSSEASHSCSIRLYANIPERDQSLVGLQTNIAKVGALDGSYHEKCQRF